DNAYYTQRMPLLIHTVVRSLRRHGVAIKLPAQAGCKIADIDHLLHLTQAFLEALAHFIRYQCAEVPLMPTQGIPKLPDDLAAPGCRHLPPVGKCSGCPVDYFIKRFSIRLPYRGERLTVNRRIAIS